MASKRNLRAVADGEKPQGKPEKSSEPRKIADAVDASERDVLVSLRSHLAREMDAGKVPAHALASVSAKIREYDREIRALDAREMQEAERRDASEAEDGSFDASAV